MMGFCDDSARPRSGIASAGEVLSGSCYPASSTRRARRWQILNGKEMLLNSKEMTQGLSDRHGVASAADCPINSVEIFPIGAAGWGSFMSRP